MASNYSSNLNMELITSGEQAGTWGDTTNQNWKRIEESRTYSEVVITQPTAGSATAAGYHDSSTNTFSWWLTDAVDAYTDNSSSDVGSSGRSSFVKFTGSPDGNVVVKVRGTGNTDYPNRVFFVTNGIGTHKLIFDVGGTAFTLENGATAAIYCTPTGNELGNVFSTLQVGGNAAGTTGLVLSDGSIKDIAGAVSFNDGNITNVGDIKCDSVSVDDAAVGLNIAFGGTTTLNKISLTDNLADALNITEGSNSYVKFITSNSSEQIVFGQDSTFASTTIANLGTVTAATSITSTDFVGALTGNVTGNASGTAATVTAGAQGSITDAVNLVTVGALDTGSITSGFSTIDVGSSAIDGGIITADTHFVGTINTGAQNSITSATALVAVGALDAGSITSGFTSIDAPIIGTATAGSSNIAIGSNAGAALAGTNSWNICIGGNAGKAIATTDNSNVFVGYNAGILSTPTRCTGVGHQALVAQLGGTDNAAFGYQALGAVTSGDDNIGIGSGAGGTNQTGDKNVFIGVDSDTSATDSTGQIGIGYGVTCIADNTVTIGISANTASLGLDGSDTSWAAASSDERLKENIETSTAGLGLVNDLRPVNYNWKKAKDVSVDMPQYVEGSDEPVLGYEYGKTLHGFIAQECKAAIDKHRSSLADGFNLWIEKDDGTQTVADGNLIPVLVKAIQELSSKIDSLESRLAALE